MKLGAEILLLLFGLTLCSLKPTGLLPRGFRQVIPGLRLALQRRDLVRIDANHQVADVIVDPGEPVARACRNDDDVARLDLVRDAVADVRTVVPRPVELDDGAQGRGTLLAVYGVQHEGRHLR